MRSEPRFNELLRRVHLLQADHTLSFEYPGIDPWKVLLCDPITGKPEVDFPIADDTSGSHNAAVVRSAVRRFCSD